MVDGRLPEKITNALYNMWAEFRRLESFTYYDYGVVFNETLALGLSY